MSKPTYEQLEAKIAEMRYVILCFAEAHDCSARQMIDNALSFDPGVPVADWGAGFRALGRSCQAALTLLKSGRWTVEQFERWLNATMAEDPEFYKEAARMIAAAKGINESS